jgi:hypothetical protein
MKSEVKGTEMPKTLGNTGLDEGMYEYMIFTV